MLAAQVDEPGRIGRLDEGPRSGRVVPGERRQGAVGVQDVVLGGEQGPDLAVVGGAQTRLDAVEQIEEAVVPALVGPVRACGGATRVRGDAQLGVTGGPRQVGHLLHVAEVGLGGPRQGGDHLVATGVHGLVVTGELLDEAGGAGRGVVDLVQVGAQVRQTRGHAAHRGARGDPAAGVRRVDSGGVDEELLDVLIGPGLQAGHSGRADHDAIDGSGRDAVGLGPAPGEVVGGPLGGADAPADAHDEVVACADGVIGGQEHGVQVLP